MYITGTLMKVEHRSGDFTPSDAAPGSAPIAYDFHVLHIWDGDGLREVRVPKDVDPASLNLAPGKDVELEVSVPKGVRIFLTEADAARLAAA